MAIGRLIWEGRRPGPLLAGHLLLYPARGPAAWSANVGLRLLLLAAVLELVIGPRAHLLDWIGLAQPAAPVRVITLAAIALIAARAAGARFDDVGLRPWRSWTLTEQLYLPQFALLATAAFVMLNSGSLVAVPGLTVLGVVATQLLWGSYQELVYRGLLQNELSRRFGVRAGILMSNVLFAFGPLHLYHLGSGAAPVSIAAGLAGVFAIGLLFGWVFHRTRNLWLVGLMHGAGNVFTNGGPELARLVGAG